MSEIKRAQLIPLGSQKESDKSSKEPRKTIRISVVLPESTEDTCPEYNYKDELAGAKVTNRKCLRSLLTSSQEAARLGAVTRVRRGSLPTWGAGRAARAQPQTP